MTKKNYIKIVCFLCLAILFGNTLALSISNNQILPSDENTAKIVLETCKKINNEKISFISTKNLDITKNYDSLNINKIKNIKDISINFEEETHENNEQKLGILKNIMDVFSRIKSNKESNFLKIKELTIFENKDLLKIFNLNLKNIIVYTKWIDENNTIYEKETNLTKTETLVDIDDDGYNDIKLSYTFLLDIIEIDDMDFSDVEFPYALGFKTNFQIERLNDCCMNDFDFFEIFVQIGFPAFLDLEEKNLRIGGYRSLKDEKIPEKFEITHVFIPYILRNMLGFSKEPEYWVTQNPGDMSDCSLDFVFGLTDVSKTEAGPDVSLIIDNSPVSVFNLKFKTQKQNQGVWSFIFDSNWDKKSNVTFSLSNKINRVYTNVSFKDIKNVGFDLGLEFDNNSTSITYSSGHSLNFYVDLLDMDQKSHFHSDVLWKKDKKIIFKIFDQSGFSLKTDNGIEFYDVLFDKNNLEFNIGKTTSDASGVFTCLLDENIGFNISNSIGFNFDDVLFKTNSYKLSAGNINSNNKGFILFLLNSVNNGFSFGSNTDFDLENLIFDSFITGDSLGFSGLFNMKSSFWLTLFKDNDVNNVEVETSGLDFSFSDCTFMFNDEEFGINGGFNFEKDDEHIMNLRWSKPNFLQIDFDKNINVNINSFIFDAPNSWMTDRLYIKNFNWSNGRQVGFDVSSDQLAIGVDTSLFIDDIKLETFEGSFLFGDYVVFDGFFNIQWFEKNIYFDVENMLNWNAEIISSFGEHWRVSGLFKGDISVNSQWNNEKTGIVQYDVGSSGFLKDFILEHEDFKLYLDFIRVEPGFLNFNWAYGDNGFFKINNNGINADLNLLDISYYPTDFNFKIQNISFKSGDASFNWVNNADTLSLEIISMINFNIDNISFSQQDNILKIKNIGLKPGVFNYTWLKTDKKIRIKNSIESFSPFISYQNSEGIFSLSLFDLESNSKITTVKWFETNGEFSGFMVDTQNTNLAEWIECQYVKDENIGVKLKLMRLHSSYFTIQIVNQQLTMSGSIGATRFILSNYSEGEWSMLVDSQWHLSGEGQGFFSLKSHPNLFIQISDIELIADKNIKLDSTVYAPSYFYISWNLILDIPVEATVTVDTDGETIGNVIINLYSDIMWDDDTSLWEMVFEGSAIAAEDFWVNFKGLLSPDITTGGWIAASSTFTVSVYLKGDEIFTYTYP